MSICRKEADERKSRDRKIERFQFTLVDHILSIILVVVFLQT